MKSRKLCVEQLPDTQIHQNPKYSDHNTYLEAYIKNK